MRPAHDDDKFNWKSGPLSQTPPEGLLPIEEHLLLTTIQVMLEKRDWELEWLEIDLENHTLNINHPSVSKEDAVEFFTELFEKIGGSGVRLLED